MVALGRTMVYWPDQDRLFERQLLAERGTFRKVRILLPELLQFFVLSSELSLHIVQIISKTDHLFLQIFVWLSICFQLALLDLELLDSYVSVL
ncbi:unnamed protein product [Periconia digitata]|uniref:Uncharacterized protein n=1 Tax=Periconia digitata TaxID=1303443 RepID=A0A9W4XUC5_9PLEO|nr:unnamed protein product [Periconia digitata]